MQTKIVELVRIEENEIYGTFGVLRINKEAFCVTLEPADHENTANISSIPSQQYICSRVTSPKYGNTFEVLNVPGRSHVLFHAGNVVDHTQGCILLAQYYDKLRGNRAVLNSGRTFEAFNKRIMNGISTFHLTIKEEY